MSDKQIIKAAIEFEKTHKSLKSTSQKVQGAKDAKELVLSLNEIYKKTKDQTLMDLMKKITVVKRKLDEKTKGKLT